jgi:hypothetical protein
MSWWWMVMGGRSRASATNRGRSVPRAAARSPIVAATCGRSSRPGRRSPQATSWSLPAMSSAVALFPVTSRSVVHEVGASPWAARR